MRTVFHSFAIALVATNASATHSANFFMFLLDQTDRRDGLNSTTAGAWPTVAILGGQKCHAARDAARARRRLSDASRKSGAAPKPLRSRCDVIAAGLAGPAGALSAPTRLEKRGILPEEWRGASP